MLTSGKMLSIQLHFLCFLYAQRLRKNLRDHNVSFHSDVAVPVNVHIVNLCCRTEIT